MDHPDELRYLIQYWRAFSRRWWLILGLALLASVGSGLYARYYVEPVYRSTCVMLLGGDGPGPLSSFLNAASLLLPGALQGGSGKQSQTMAILNSRRLASIVVGDLDLVKEYGAPSERSAIDRLLKYTRFDSGREGQLWITADAPTARLAADIPNAYHRALEAYRQRDDASSAQRNLKFVERMLLRTKSDLRAAEEALRTYQQRNAVILPDSTTQAIIGRRAQIEVDSVTNAMDLKTSRKRLDALRARMVQRAQSEGAPAISNAGEVERLRGRLVQLQSDIELARSAYTEDHPQVRELQESIDIARRQLRELVEKSVTAAYDGVLPELIDLEVGVIVGETRGAALQVEMGRLDGVMRSLPKTMLDYSRLARDVRVTESVYQGLVQEHQKARIAAAQETPPIRLLDPAELPLAPHIPNPRRSALLGAIWGLVAGLLLAVILQFGQTVRQISAAEREIERAARSRPSAREVERVGRE